MSSSPPHLDDAAPIGRQVSMLLVELTGRLHAHLSEVAESVDLTLVQARALHHLDEIVPMGDVATQLRCDASNVTGIIDRLEEQGLVRREADPADRRRKLLVLTPQGEETRARMHQRLVSGHPVLTTLSAEEQTQLRDLLRKAVTEAGDGPSSAA